MTVTNGAKAPLSFFPSYFFEENHDLCWYGLLKLPENPLGRHHYLTLLKSPMTYLGLNDLKLLFYYQFQSCLFEFKANKSEINREKDLFKLMNFLNSSPHESELVTNEGRAFLEMANCYYHFYLALRDEGSRSRKLMSVAYYHLKEFSKYIEADEERNALYMIYLESLIEIGRGNWDQATTLLHKTLKKNLKRPLVVLLCHMYIEIGMPQVAKFVAKKYNRKLGHQELKTLLAA